MATNSSHPDAMTLFGIKLKSVKMIGQECAFTSVYYCI